MLNNLIFHVISETIDTELGIFGGFTDSGSTLTYAALMFAFIKNINYFSSGETCLTTASHPRDIRHWRLWKFGGITRLWQVSHVLYFTHVYFTHDVSLQIDVLSHVKLWVSRHRHSGCQVAYDATTIHCNFKQPIGFTTESKLMNLVRCDMTTFSYPP